MKRLLLASLIIIFVLVVEGNVQGYCNIRDFGVTASKFGVQTREIQKAIDSCSHIYFPKGVYMTGTISLHSNMVLELERGATLQGSPFFIRHGAMIFANNARNISFIGGGEIFGGGIHENEYKVFHLTNCDQLVFENFKVRQIAHDWCFLCQNCSNVYMTNFYLDGYHGRDGLDLVGCKNVFIQNSVLLGKDDALALKSNRTIYSDLDQAFDTENVHVWDCELSSMDCNAMQFGSESPGNFNNISFRNIQVKSAGKAGIGITSNDGGHISNVSYQNITMTNVVTPFWIKLTNRTPPVGTISHIHIENVSVTHVLGLSNGRNFTATLDGFNSEHRLGPDITFDNIKISYVGGGSLCAVDILPPDPATDYRPRYLGDRPSYGFYIRHANGVRLRNISVSYDSPDLRPAFYLDTTTDVQMSDVTVSREKDTLCDCDVILKDAQATVISGSSLDVLPYEKIPPCPHDYYYPNPYD